MGESNLGNSVSIAIPIYKAKLDEFEHLSLKRCLEVFSEYSIIFFCSESLDLKFYKTLLLNNKLVSFTFFDEKYFESIDGYNQLMLSAEFYQRFKYFKFILIYQLDAFVFSNELDYWCSQDYDYIGAPWYEDLHNANSGSKFIGVGNGGFSLRKVKSHLKVLHSFSYVNSPVKMMKETFKNRGLTFRSLLHVISNFTFRNNTFYLFNNFNSGEDIFWGQIVFRSFKNFRLPNERTAYKFAMEIKAPQLYEANDKTLPFGCHAWERYHKDFWMQFINVDEEKG